MSIPALFPRARTRRLIALLATIVTIASVLSTGIADAQPSCFGRAATIVARPGQVTYGTSGADVIVGTSGADRIRGRGGADLICSGAGRDRVWGGKGRDVIDLGGGNDIGRGGSGGDTIRGGTGVDFIRGKSGHDTIDGGGGIDDCKGGRGVDQVSSCNEQAAPPPSASSLSSAERQMADLVNDLRSDRGMRGLTVSVDMSDVARNWSGRLPDGFRHNPNVSSQLPDGWWSWGENIAYNASVNAAFEALVDSPGHLSNMINSGYTHLGVGVHTEGGRVYVTQVFARY